MFDEAPPPRPDEAEFSLFGPGVGECAVVHLGAGQWLVVDSCRERGSGEPVALRYLTSLGVDLARDVKFVILTHWHSDHCEGAAELFAATEQAKFVASDALNQDEFLELVGHERTSSGFGLDEISQVLEVLERRSPGPPEAAGPEWASADRRLFNRPSSARVPGCEVWALSPSSASKTLALREFAAVLDSTVPYRRRTRARSPNEYSVVLWIDIGGRCILLGGDLETSANPARGWTVILGSEGRPTGKARYYKVPHHGSENADDPAIWKRLLKRRPHALLTPFNRGKRLPTDEDIKRLRSRTKHLFITSDPREWQAPRRHPAVERAIRDQVRARRVVRGPMGQVRIRWSLSSVFARTRVKLFGAASRLR